MSPRSRFLVPLAISAVVSGVVTGCQPVPGSGRSQFNFMPESQMAAMSEAAFADVKKQKLSHDAAKTACLKRVGARIVAEARKVAPALPPYEKWEFVVVEDDTANAFAMAGGKVAFHTGIFKLMHSDDEVAIVMGHEVSHVICRHSGERVSQQMLQQAGGYVTAVAADRYVKSNAWRSVITVGYGAGTQYLGILPYSRRHESEADILGVRLSARAGYDPQVSIPFWEKMSAGGGSPPEFLSTHPSGDTRIRDLRKAMPEASAEYQRARSAGLPAGQRW